MPSKEAPNQIRLDEAVINLGDGLILSKDRDYLQPKKSYTIQVDPKFRSWHIIDDLQASEQVSNNTTTFADIVGLGQTLEAGNIYEIELVFVWDTIATTTGIKFTFAGPSLPSVYSGRVDIPISTTSAGVMHYATPNTETPTANAARLNNNYAYARYIFGANTTGLYYPRFASEINGNAVTIKRGTNIKIRKLN